MPKQLNKYSHSILSLKRPSNKISAREADQKNRAETLYDSAYIISMCLNNQRLLIMISFKGLICK